MRRLLLTTELIRRIDEVISSKSLLKHPFYQSWSKGELPKESLKQYAKEYFHFEAMYPTFLSAVHSRCSDRKARQLILDNLWDEEHGDENHVELWLRFCDALGLDREEVENGEASQATQDLIDEFTRLTSTKSVASGTASLYAFESQVPEVAVSKLEGLSKHYNMAKSSEVAFFKVHSTLDEEHSEAEREIINTMAVTDEIEEETIVAVKSAADSLWNFLDSVYEVK